jgi:TonB family protein
MRLTRALRKIGHGSVARPSSLSDNTPADSTVNTAGSLAGIVAAVPASAVHGSTPTFVLLPDAAEKRLIKKVQPEYPLAARKASIQGDVEFTVIVSEQGRVKSLQLLRGDPSLIEEARDAVRKWEYEPVVVGGEPKEFVTTVQVHFVVPR